LAALESFFGSGFLGAGPFFGAGLAAAPPLISKVFLFTFFLGSLLPFLSSFGGLEPLPPLTGAGAA
jgi:hypothetical protein